MDAMAIKQIRSFNRTVVEGIGALDDRFLGRARPMAEARVLWEIGTAGADLHGLRTRLGLDSTALARILRSLERQRLVRVVAADRRTRRAVLTRAGLSERAELDRRSDAVALRMLDPLSDHQRQAFVAAVAEVERLLHASMVRFAIEDPASADARWCVAQYFAELQARFETGFNPARSIPADAHELTPPAGALFIARLRGQPVGCGALKLHGSAPAETEADVDRAVGARPRPGKAPASCAGTACARSRCGDGTARNQPRADRGDRALPAVRYVEVAAFNAEPYAHHWFEKVIG